MNRERFSFLTHGWERTVLAAVLAAGLLAACGGATDDEPADGVRVVATTTILGDLARNVIHDAGTVEVLLPVGADPHDYQASSRQAAAVAEADLVVANGLGLEEGLADLLGTAASDGVVVLEIAPLLDPIPFGADGQGQDPHVWLDPLRAADGAAFIAESLADIDPTIDWATAADTYRAQLIEAHEQITTLLEPIPVARRRLVTNHDSLGYFAERYGFEIIGTVVPGGATLAEPSSSALAALVEAIERSDVPAIFADSTTPSQLAASVASEVDRDVAVVELFTGSLGGADSPATTLIDLLLENARRIALALEPPPA